MQIRWGEIKKSNFDKNKTKYLHRIWKLTKKEIPLHFSSWRCREESSTPAALLLSSTTHRGKHIFIEYQTTWNKIKLKGKLYLSARGMHDRSRGRRWSTRNLLIDPETQQCSLNLCRYEQKTKTKPFLQLYLLESWGFHWIFLHFHHTDDPLFGPWIESHSLLGWCISMDERRRLNVNIHLI